MDWNEPKKSSWLNTRVLAWATYDFGVTIFSMNVISRYFGPWVVYEKHGSVAQFNDAVWISLALAAVIQILWSPISDELGKRRVFVLGFTLLSVVGCAMISFASSLTWGLIYFGVAHLGYQTAMVFYNAMLGDVADQRHEARVSGIGIGVGYVGAILGLLISEKVVNTELHHYQPIFWLTAVLVLVFTLPLVLFLKEKPSLVKLDLSQSLRNSFSAFATTLRRIGRRREILFFFIGCLLALDAVNAVIVNMALYCETVVGLDSAKGILLAPMWKERVLFQFTITEINLFLITSTVFAILGSFVIGHISDKTSHYRTLVGVLILWIFTLALAMFSVKRKLFWITGPLFGLGFGGIWTVSRAYLQQLCHPEERSQMFAIFGLVGRGAAILGTFTWARVYTYCNPILGENKAYRCSIGAVLILLILGLFFLMASQSQKKTVGDA
jgi:UMF1 family MFS transporter